MLKLVHEVKTNVSEADRWYGEDLAALQAYVKSMGKANDMTPSYSTSNSTSLNPFAPSDSSHPLTLPSQAGIQVQQEHADSNTDLGEPNTLVNSSQSTHLKLNEAQITEHATSDTANDNSNNPTVDPTTNDASAPTAPAAASDGDINSTNMSTLAKMLGEEIRLVIPGKHTYVYIVLYCIDRLIAYTSRVSTSATYVHIYPHVSLHTYR